VAASYRQPSTGPRNYIKGASLSESLVVSLASAVPP
jgi:hypothetical protein